jgi:hypothetical protein
MFFLPEKKSSRLGIEINLTCLAILFFIFRQSNPLFKFPFLLIYFPLLVYVLFRYNEKIICSLKKFIIDYLFVIILLLIICISFLFSDKFFLLIFKDTLSGIIILSLFFIMTIIISSKTKLIFFLDSFLKLIIIFSLFISIFGYLDLLGIIPYKEYFLVENTPYSQFPYDYNFGLLPVLFGFSGLLYYILTRNYSLVKVLFINLLLAFYSGFIFFSGSKRGIFAFAVFITIITGIWIKAKFKKKFLNGRVSLNLGFYFLFLLSIIFCFYLFLTQISFTSKNNFLEKIGTKDIINTKEQLSNNIYKTFSIFYKKNSLREFHEKLWSISYDSRDPDLGWGGLGIHKTIFPLSGKNVDIVPVGSKGFLMDSTYKCDTWDGNAYSITLLGRLNVESTQKVETSVFCYVSDDFNGDCASLILLHTKEGEIHSDYNLQSKGCWQNLLIADDCLGNAAESRFYFCKNGTTNFSSLNGYVILAYPQFSVIDADGNSRTLYSSTFKLSENSHNKLISSSLFDFSFILPMNNNIYIFDNDPIRDWVRKLISEDTCYHGYKAKIKMDSIAGPLNNDDRLAHWKFASEIFSKEYNYRQKIFGGGFDHLNWFGYYFLNDKTMSDWPHNPFLSVLLYSGIIGLIIYFYFIYEVFSYYFKYIRKYPVFFIFFIITFFFSFFSGGSPFDPPVMGFFVMLPFFINSINKKEAISNEESDIHDE